ncbi:FAD binding domain-containing protein [Aspergillus avenaceus]|uniref:FAD binding domain-containing protein n=1 Tax=Aspergillus avenaceus TaxID=36643 RepID=A0A5N6TKP6_ASPAV|nr:FAD binding domain-containing protein [Aspergillus avenaceus]
MEDNYDVVVIGAGPVGLMLSACLLRLGPYKIKHIDNNANPTQIGRADGIQARTLDVLKGLDLTRAIFPRKPGYIREVAFWSDHDDESGLTRTGSARTYPNFIVTRHPFTTILHQGHIEDIFLQDLAKRGLEIQRPWTVDNIYHDASPSSHPLQVTLATVDGHQKRVIRSKYVFGADGAHSQVRSLLGIPMIYKDSKVHVWGVIDGIVDSDFPDIRIKCTVRSAKGSAMVIPQSGNHVRIYVQLFSQPDGADPDLAKESQIKQTANDILSPYHVEWQTIDWCSTYRIRQGVAESYSLHERVFIGGDACHTHSPKAGQGMNYGLLDAHNLAWKLHLVEAGFLQRQLLRTYEEERKHVADRLIEFDCRYANLFSAHVHGERMASNAEFIRVFKENTLLTSGYGVEYASNSLIDSGTNSEFPTTVWKAIPGRSLPIATVTRVISARVVYLEQDVPFNGSFHIYVFAGRPSQTFHALSDLATYVASATFPLHPYQRDPPDRSYEARHNPESPFFTYSFIFNTELSSIDFTQCLPRPFSVYRYHTFVDDQPARAYADAAAHNSMGIDSTKGGVVVVRPDGYVGCVLPLEEGPATGLALAKYFAQAVVGTG